jgi:superfamily I DNA and/or RNA helicase
VCRWERRQLYKELDKLRAEIDAVTRKLCAELLEQADVVGVTCTGAAGPELQHMAFDMVVLDEGSQASE